MATPIHGISLTPLTQCAHYATPQDILSIQHVCCLKFYACIRCHNALEAHESGRWPRARWEEKAVRCGRCEGVMGIAEYMAMGGLACKACGAQFNKGCKNHWGLYFEMEGGDRHRE